MKNKVIKLFIFLAIVGSFVLFQNFSPFEDQSDESKIQINSELNQDEGSEDNTLADAVLSIQDQDFVGDPFAAIEKLGTPGLLSPSQDFIISCVRGSGGQDAGEHCGGQAATKKGVQLILKHCKNQSFPNCRVL